MDNQGECIMPLTTDERRQRFLDKHPEWQAAERVTVSLNVPEGDAKVLGASIVEALRKSPFRGL